MDIIGIGNTLIHIARDPAWGAIGTLIATLTAIILFILSSRTSFGLVYKKIANGTYDDDGVRGV